MNVVSLSLCYPSAQHPKAGVFVRHRLRALAERAPVQVIHPVPTPVWSPRQLDHAGETDHPAVLHVPMPYVPILSKPLNPRLYARAVYPALESLHRRRRVDVLDAHFCWPDGVAADLLARKLGVPFSITLRGLLRRFSIHPVYGASVRRALRRANRIIAVSHDLKAEATALGTPPDRIDVIPNGVDTAVFTPADRTTARRLLRRPLDEKVLVTVGHLCPRKGVQRVLSALPALLAREKTIRYVVVGSDGMESKFSQHLKKQTQKLGLERFVTFTGALDQEHIATWLQASDVFVLPTDNEGCCNALVEARTCGLPIVCTDVGGNREIVSGESGILIPRRDERALIDAVTTILAWPRRSAEQPPSRAARSWRAVGKETFASLQQALSCRAPLQTPEVFSPTSATRPAGREKCAQLERTLN